MHLTLKQYIDGVAQKKFSPAEVMQQYLAKAKQENEKYNAFVRFHEEYVQSRQESFFDKSLHGAPIGVKDLIMTEGYITSCASKMLETYVPPYSATCMTRLEAAGGCMIGKTNCDQFGMGGSNENSYFGPVINCHGTNRVPGGSSGGSAVAVAADFCLAALGTDTGGSCRQPAALCNIVGLKPTYGRVSRYGVVPYCSSFDQVGVLAKTVEDVSIMFEAIAGWDERDATTEQQPVPHFDPANISHKKVTERKLAVPKQFFVEGLDERVKIKTEQTINALRKEGVQVDEIDVPILEYTLPVYYIIVTAEASANLARLDGIRYGLQDDTYAYENIQDYYKKIRSDGFLDETKRRILTGTFVLSSENYEGYYLKATKIQKKLQQECKKIFSTYDAIIGPTSPEVAWKLGGEKLVDPVKMYLTDIYTVTANLTHICALSVPNGFVADQGEQMPIGIQLMADKWQEEKLFEIGSLLEKII